MTLGWNIEISTTGRREGDEEEEVGGVGAKTTSRNLTEDIFLIVTI